ncbi:MAG: NAD+ synthase [Parachlamydiaceae bacterium]|nr:NAD+ synthase [Parachlamydiaceae bacterium]
MRILLAQINPIIGDLEGNTKQILDSIQNGREQKADVILFPEMALSGYPPEDFLLMPHFLEAVLKKLDVIIKASKNITVIVGLPRQNKNRSEKTLFNSAAVISDCKLLGFQDKVLLPTYDIFDERRYFEPGAEMKLWDICGKKVAITICEDLWQHSGFVLSTFYRRDPVLELKQLKPNLLLNLSSSPYSMHKFNNRLQVCLKTSATLKCPVLLCNQVGGNDSLIFDGYSLYVTPEGLVHCCKGFIEDKYIADLNKKSTTIRVIQHVLEDLYKALVMGLKDYFNKLGFKKACLGLSGGIDSALVACIASEALGSENVLAINMPSRFSAPESARDAKQLCDTIGIQYKEISIESSFQSYLDLLRPHFQDVKADVTEENLQARIRGMILMAFSNKFGYIVLSTGNKSELAVGYSTLYGDMVGGVGVINDLTKQQVYALSNWINRDKEIIPLNTIKRAPTAELRLNQKDSDSLPDYEVLDNVVCSYIEEHLSPQQIAEKFKYDLQLVDDLIKRIHQNEYKRRQAPPGLRVTEKAFSIGRRFPIVQRWT